MIILQMVMQHNQQIRSAVKLGFVKASTLMGFTNPSWYWASRSHPFLLPDSNYTTKFYLIFIAANQTNSKLPFLLAPVVAG